jgi:ABC-type molybdate transport system substrate-binding protein
MTVKGDFINYSVTVLDNAVNKADAIDFVSFLLSRDGMEILRKNGQNPIQPYLTEEPDKLPGELRKFFSTN